jgi:RimJ/RimL family protein N-acetyltransferase
VSASSSGRTPTPRVRIVHLPAAVLDALAAADLAAANRASPVPLTQAFVSADWLCVWRYRSRQVRDDPAAETWVTGALWDERAEACVGRAGFHGPPDERGMVEVGYAVDQRLRRRGYGRAAVAAMLTRAAAEPAVSVVRASVSPSNVPSLNLIAQFGFVKVGEQWDEEDGLEEVFEVAAGAGFTSDPFTSDPFTRS